MVKKLHALRGTFTEGKNKLELQKISDENIMVIGSFNGVPCLHMTITVTQLREVGNRLDLWDKQEIGHAD